MLLPKLTQINKNRRIIMVTATLKEISQSEKAHQFKAIEEHFISIVGGHIFFKTLSAATKFDLFTILNSQGALTQEQISLALNIPIRSAKILLLGLVSLKLINKEGHQYDNALISDIYLSKNSPQNILSLIDWQSEINYRAMDHFYDSLISGENEGLKEFDGEEDTLYKRLTHTPHLENIFQSAMEDISKHANYDLANNIDFSQVKNLLDVGGGNASNIINLANFYPKLKASVFDSKSVCAIANENIKNNNRADQCQVQRGDCFNTPYPSGYDAISYCHFLTIWSEEKNIFLIKKAYDSLPDGGKLIIFNMMQNNEEDGPLTAAMGSPYFLTLATKEGMIYTWAEYESWCQQAGFSEIVSTKLPKNHGVIMATK